MREGRVTANGIDFAYLEEGDGPLVLLLHGYPDNARTWEAQMRALADAGFRAVAPFTRGYPPTQVPDGGYFDTPTLATDARELILALGDGGPAHVVGHDWGAATTFYLIAGYPEVVRRAVTMAIPHPMIVVRAMSDPTAVHRAFHWWFFQLPGLPETAIRANDFAFIDYLWRFWSPGHDDRAHVDGIKRMFETPGAVEASLAYYRSIFDPARQDPALAGVRATIAGKITVPTLSIIGSRDAERSEPGEAQAEFFDGEFAFESVPETGHFLHREAPDVCSKLIVDWLTR
jgi:pimeloyl-ACP methyl ester carboxylesterase